MSNIWVKRPGGGDYAASDFSSLLGRVAKKDISADRRITHSDVSGL